VHFQATERFLVACCSPENHTAVGRRRGTPWRAPYESISRGSSCARVGQRPMETPPKITPPLAAVGARHGAGLSKLTASRGQDGGSAALLCGKASPFRAVPRLSFSFTRAGRLSLPAQVEEDLKDGRPSERQGLSAQPAAEPQSKARRLERNLDKPVPWRAPT